MKDKIWGAIHSTKISGNFRLKLNGLAQSKRNSFEKTGPPFEVDHFTRLDRSDRNWPFHLTFSVKFLFPVPRCSLLSIGVMSSGCVTQYMFRLFKNGLFPERFDYSFRYSKVVFEEPWTKPAHIWVYSKQPSKISTHAAVRTISLIKTNLSLTLTRATVISIRH